MSDVCESITDLLFDGISNNIVTVDEDIDIRVITLQMEIDKIPKFCDMFCLKGPCSVYMYQNVLEILISWILSGATKENVISALKIIGEQSIVNTNMLGIRKVWLYRNSCGADWFVS